MKTNEIIGVIAIGGGGILLALLALGTVKGKKPQPVSKKFVKSVNISILPNRVVRGGKTSMKYKITPEPKSVIPKTIWGTIVVSKGPQIKTKVTVPPYQQKVILSEKLEGTIDMVFKEAGNFRVYLVVDNVKSNTVSVIVSKAGLHPLPTRPHRLG